ncbi:MAG: DUF3857 domain-containing protein, partial [Proteobacteria bacterium]|nr:DUF3857 domain-containing protein [Pseudomonadota bacterium]
QIDSQKICLSSSSKAFDTVTSPRYNYAIDLRGTPWQTWEELKKSFPEAETGAIMNEGRAWLIVPVAYDNQPHMEALTHVLMESMDLAYPSTMVFDFKPYSTGTSQGLEFGYKDGEYSYRIDIIAGQKQALLFCAWTWDGSSPDPLYTHVRSRLVLSHGANPPDSESFSKQEKKNQATHMNRFGLFYYDTKQYEKSFTYFKTAHDQFPENESYFLNCLKTLNQLNDYAQGLKMMESCLPGLDQKPVFLSWHAWFLQNTGQTDKALSVYQKMFAKDYRDDIDFIEYINLLQEFKHWNEAETAFEHYFQKGDSIELRMEHARCLSRQKKYDEAITILNTLQKNISFNSAIAYALIKNYTQSNQLTKAFNLCGELISQGYDSANAYYTKGDIEYELKRYREAKISLEKALTYSPEDKDIKDYIQHIAALLGEGNNSSIKQPIDPVPLPDFIQKTISTLSPAPRDNGYDAYYIHMIEGFAFIRGKELKRTIYKKIKVLNTGGVDKFSSMEFDFNPLTETVYVNTLDVLDKQGNIIAKGKPSDYYVIDKQANSMATFDQTLNITVPNLSPGNIISLVVTINKKGSRDTLPFYERALASSRPVLYSCIFYSGSLEDIRFQESHLNGHIKTDSGMAWFIDKPAPYHFEPLQVDYEQIVPLLKFTDASNTWETEGRNYLKDIDGKLCSSPQTTALSKTLTKTCKTRKEKIDALVSHIQKNYTYKAIEFGRRAWSPNTPSTIMNNKYGDCKDHAVLLHQLLTDIHIPSHLALVSTDTITDDSLPSMDQFNHMIVHIPVKNGAGLFIDTTDKDIDPNIPVPQGIGGHMALVLDAKDIRLEKIPNYALGSSSVRNRCDIRVANDGKSMQINDTLTLSGYSADFMRSHLKAIEEIKQPRWAKNILTGYLKEDAELLSFYVENLYTNTHDLILKLSYKMTCQAWEKKGFQFDIPAPWESYYLETRPVNTRQTPFQIHYPFDMTREITVTSLSGMAPGLDMAGDRKKSHDFGTWETRASRTDSSFGMAFNLRFNPGIYPAERYQDYCKMVNEAIKTLETKVTFTPQVAL